MIDEALFSLPGIKRVLALLAGFAFLRALAIIGQAITLASAITNLWYGGQLVDQLLFIALFFSCFVGKQGIVYLQDSILERYAFEQADALRQSLLEKIFTTKAQLVQDNGTGSVTAAVLEGIDQIETYFRLILPKITSIFVIPVLLVIVVCTLDWVSGLIMFIAFPFIILYMKILGMTAKAKAAKQHRTFQIMSNHFIDTLRGIDTLKLFGVSERRGASIYHVSERFREATMKTLAVANLSSVVLDLFSTLSIAAVAFMLGMRLLDGSLLLYPAMAILVIAPEYFKPIREFASDYHASLDGKNALMHVRSLIAAPEDPIKEHKLATWSTSSLLNLQGIGCSLSGSRVLQNVTLNVHGFQKIGIVGMSGAGKSTLINVLGGFRLPDEGLISIDGTTVADFRQTDWQKQVIYIPQDPYIFHATLRENVAFYSPKATEEEIAEATRIVGLDELIAELPEGLATRIGEGARPLSGGQAQRIALARAFLDRSRRILLFDEPTAHLDIETEMELKERMLPLMKDRLVIFATHRLHWMHDMDSIAVMDLGCIVEYSTLPNLVAAKGAFTALTSQIQWGEA